MLPVPSECGLEPKGVGCPNPMVGFHVVHGVEEVKRARHPDREAMAPNPAARSRLRRFMLATHSQNMFCVAYSRPRTFRTHDGPNGPSSPLWNWTKCPVEMLAPQRRQVNAPFF